MSNVDRIALIRERLAPCQLALRQLQSDIALGKHVEALDHAEALAEAFLDLEAATGAVVTPPILLA